MKHDSKVSKIHVHFDLHRLFQFNVHRFSVQINEHEINGVCKILSDPKCV